MKNLVTLVKEMRNAQKLYFRTRGVEALKKSKRLEKEVDELVSDQIKMF